MNCYLHRASVALLYTKKRTTPVRLMTRKDMKGMGKWLSVSVLFPLLPIPEAGVVVEFSFGGFDVGDGRDLVEEEDFEDGITFSVVVVTGLVALFSVDVFVFVGSEIAVVATSLLFKLWPFDVTSSPPAVRSREEARKITLKANILRKG